MDSTSLVEEIFKEIHEHDNLDRELEEYKRKCAYNGVDYDIDHIDNFESDIYNSRVRISQLIDRLYYQSIHDNFFFFDCQFKVYSKYYSEKLQNYQTENPDASEEDFLNFELEYYSNPDKNRVLFKEDLVWIYYNYNSFIDSDNEKFKTSLNKKIDFLKKKLETPINNLGIKMKTSESDKDSQLLVEEIIKHNKFLIAFYKNLEASYTPFNFDEDIFNYQIEREEGEKESVAIIKKMLNELYLQSNKDNYYFFDCTLKAYLSNIDKKIKDYLELHVDANMIDFYKTEINYLLTPGDNRLLYSRNKKDIANYSAYCNDFSNFEISLNKKIEYITNELIGLGVETTIEENYIGRDGDQLVKSPIFEKIKRPYTPHKVKVIIPSPQEKIVTINKTPSAKKSDYNTKIFRSKEAEDWFRETLFNMNAISEDNKMIRGLSAVSDAIYKNEKCKEHIFKNRPQLKNFIEHLNNKFEANIKSDKKLSDGSRYIDKIQPYVNQFIRGKSV